MIIHRFPLHFYFFLFNVFFLIFKNKILFCLNLSGLRKIGRFFLFYIIKIAFAQFKMSITAYKPPGQNLSGNYCYKKSIKIFITPWLLVTMESVLFILILIGYIICYIFPRLYFHRVFINCQSQITTPLTLKLIVKVIFKMKKINFINLIFLLSLLGLVIFLLKLFVHEFIYCFQSWIIKDELLLLHVGRN